MPRSPIFSFTFPGGQLISKLLADSITNQHSDSECILASSSPPEPVHLNRSRLFASLIVSRRLGARSAPWRQQGRSCPDSSHFALSETHIQDHPAAQ